MKRLILLWVLVLLAARVGAQSVTFFPSSLQYDDDAVLLNARYGQWADYGYVTFVNQSGQHIIISGHVHHHLQFLYYVDDNNRADHQVTINLPTGASCRLRITAKLAQGDPLTYNDDLGFDVKYADNGSAYFEMRVSTYFYNREVTSDERPPGYHFWDLNGVPRRIPAQSLPVKVYSNHTALGVDDDWLETIKKALDTWNNAAVTAGLSNDFFVYTNRSSEAELVIDWSGTGLPSSALGVAKLSNSNPSYIMGVTMRPPGSEEHSRTAEVLIQEMGHILGLEHSDYRDDLMNGTAHGHIHTDLSQVELTVRDRQMLRWLYTRQNCIDILPR